MVVSLMSSGILTAAMTNWLGRKRDREVELLRNQLAEGSYVTRTQYDLELESYRKLWPPIWKIQQGSGNLLRGFLLSDVSYHGVEEDWREANFDQVFEEFKSSHNATTNAVGRSAPFITEDILKKSHEVTYLSNAIINYSLKMNDARYQREWYLELKKMREPLVAKIESVRHSIRDRLNEMHVR